MRNEISEVSTVNDTSREKTIVKTSIIGIIANVFLAAFKAVIGLMTHSIAIVLDAVNNISDAGSSLITIIGTKLAGREPDKKHPFGYGRIEYLSAMIISVIVLYAGVTSFIESVKKIISPQTPEYSIASLVIVGVAVVVKIVLGRYVKSVGTKVNSDSLVNSGEDATLDSIISASTLVAAVIFMIFGLSLEAWLGAIISLVIIKSGFEMLKDTISQILGERSDPDLAKSIKQTVTEFDGVEGAYDLVLNNYGPDKHLGSIHIEVPDTWTADKIDNVTRKITSEIYHKHNVSMTAVGVYSVNTKHNSAAEIRSNVSKIVHEHKDIIQMHGFYINEIEKIMRFDLVVSFDSPNMKTMYNHVLDDVREAYPDYDIQAQFDFDVSD